MKSSLIDFGDVHNVVGVGTQLLEILLSSQLHYVADMAQHSHNSSSWSYATLSETSFSGVGEKPTERDASLPKIHISPHTGLARVLAPSH